MAVAPSSLAFMHPSWFFTTLTELDAGATLAPASLAWHFLSPSWLWLTMKCNNPHLALKMKAVETAAVSVLRETP